MEDVVIFGTGPAGLTAAIYAARAELSPVVLRGDQPGGQVTITEAIDNFPGFPNGIAGFELFQSLEKQAERFGAKIVADTAIEVDFKNHPFTIKARESSYQAKSVIIATGSDPRKLNVPGEKEYVGKGVSYCATCDGFFFKGKKVVVVGGGDSAVEEGLFLTKFATSVTLIHRRDRLRAHAHLQSRANANEKMKFIWDSVVTEVLGKAGGVQALRLQNLKTQEESIFDTDGMFVFVGHIPNTQVFKGQIKLDESDLIITDRRQRTDVPGVFAAGDVQDPIYKQAITSAGTGCMAAMEAERFLAEQTGEAYPGKLE
ncbi:thioredoxin-disulfide reductase [candidate division KSB1 bacterium]|nr:thioredoxin-disulfide reductase [candidate division KSB1 bacterium]